MLCSYESFHKLDCYNSKSNGHYKNNVIHSHHAHDRPPEPPPRRKSDAEGRLQEIVDTSGQKRFPQEIVDTSGSNFPPEGDLTGDERISYPQGRIPPRGAKFFLSQKGWWQHPARAPRDLGPRRPGPPRARGGCCPPTLLVQEEFCTSRRNSSLRVGNPFIPR